MSKEFSLITCELPPPHQGLSSPRLLGLDTGNPAADGEAEMWIMALIGKGFNFLDYFIFPELFLVYFYPFYFLLLGGLVSLMHQRISMNSMSVPYY